MLKCYTSTLTNAEDGIDWCMLGILFATSSSIRFAKVWQFAACKNLLCPFLPFNMFVRCLLRSRPNANKIYLFTRKSANCKSHLLKALHRYMSMHHQHALITRHFLMNKIICSPFG